MNLRFIAILLLSLTGFHSGLCQFSWMRGFKPDGYYSGAESLSIDTDNNVVVVGNFNE